MMMGVTVYGTAAPARRARPPDRPGKTGTTNDSRDTWFIGSVPDLTIGIYIGFDEPRTLGRQRKQGESLTAAPIYERIAKVVFKDEAADPIPHSAGPAHRPASTTTPASPPAPAKAGSSTRPSSPAPNPARATKPARVIDGSAPFSGIDLLPLRARREHGRGGHETVEHSTGTGETYSGASAAPVGPVKLGAAPRLSRRSARSAEAQGPTRCPLRTFFESSTS